MGRQLYPAPDVRSGNEERVHRLEEEVRALAEAIRLLARVLADAEGDPEISAQVAQALRRVEHPR